MGVMLPETQRAVQLLGPDRLAVNRAKPVPAPGPHQILCRVEAVGLCFSDLKLLKQFADHPRKSEVVAGLDRDTLSQIPSYVPGELPTVPGHEAVVRIWATGPGVTRFRRGERYLVQADYRWLRTAGANAALGYNFEGALQEYVLMDERVITSPEGETMLIPASAGMSASAIALVEPWACVEDAYRTRERQTLKAGGQMLVVAEEVLLPRTASLRHERLHNLLSSYGRPAHITWVGPGEAPGVDARVRRVDALEQLEAASYDDIVYLGSRAESIERLWDRAAPQALVNIVLCGGRLARRVETAVGSVHYRGMRIIGTTGPDPAAALVTIPASGEIRENDRINVIGAAGPMGAMHVIRDLCQGVAGVSIWAGDVDDERLGVLRRMAEPLARERGLTFHVYHALREKAAGPFSYVVVMVPVPEMAAEAVDTASEGAIINIFAGISAGLTADVDLNRYIEKRMYFAGTSGSVVEDMHAVLAKMDTGALDTNLSVAAISDLDGAVDGLRAVERREIAGKIVVYPACRELGLVRLAELSDRLPAVGEKLKDGVWTREAEQMLLDTCGGGKNG
jgi:threonine dehydrogenase-like Zn-dependent dehydrogenase